LPALTERAPAKVNLSLHVLARREDGYHRLESLVVFADLADVVGLTPGDGLELMVSGPFAREAGPLEGNLVLKAALALAALVPDLTLGRFTLEKHIPVAAGLGGGSADAAAALRLIARANDLSRDDPRLFAAARATGADVPVCLDPRPALMRGIGDEIERFDLPELAAVLVNPGEAVPTTAVFAALGLALGKAHRHGPHPSLTAVSEPRELLRRLGKARNDLEDAAQQIAPAIGDVMRTLGEVGARLVRMSGSGATVVGLADDWERAIAMAAALSARHLGWWVRPVRLGAGLDLQAPS
jgi:4-diphosphocytidyl-2-C-methyl-D-erythritol kinase